MTKSELIKQKLESHKRIINVIPFAYWLVMAGVLYWASSIGIRYGMDFNSELFVLSIVPLTVLAGLIWMFKWRLDYGLFNVVKLLRLDAVYIGYPILAMLLLLILLLMFGTYTIIILMILSMMDKNIN